MTLPDRIWDSCILYWIFVLLPHISCYNLDSKYPILYKGPDNSYFGYSVGLLRNRDGYRSLITAPRANSSKVFVGEIVEPGALFSCYIQPPSTRVPLCDEIIVDTTGNAYTYTFNDNYSYRDKKDNMWLGVSLDVQQGTTDNNVVVCGHLWKNQYYKDHYLANGVCYMINSDLDTTKVKKLVPFVNKAKQSLSPPGIYYYAFGQAGASAAFSADGQYLLLGGPGYYDWIGTILSYNLGSMNNGRNFERPIIPDPPFRSNPSSDGYIGYSITSGRFYGGTSTYSAVGAPRDGDNHGRVYIFEPLSTTSRKFIVRQKKEGMQFGEYFGASVCGTDLNNDGLTDLLVGAPFHSTESGGDEGKVYVYISNAGGLQIFAELFGENKPNARFGTSIANVGDLNQDGYNDIAIGAPYEDKNGAIYIYHGTSKGLNPQYVQRIGAKELNPQLAGFGISISHGLDVDNNSYPDILVGSYSSSNSVLLRTYPVISLSSKLEFEPAQISRNVTACNFQGEKFSCFNVTYCIKYFGKHASLSLDFDTELKMDFSRRSSASSGRGFFLSGNEKQPLISKKAKLVVGSENCLTETAYIYNNIKDVITPMQFFLSYNYVHHGTSFCSSCPLIDPSSPMNNTKSIAFQTGCGSDNTCKADLVVEAYVSGNQDNTELIIGQTTTLTLEIKISNRGEPAYLSELYIYLPPEVSLVKQDLCNVMNDQQQKETANATLQCDLGNPLKSENPANIQIKIDVKKIPISTKSLNIFFKAVTVSEEIDSTDNYFRLPIKFKAVADISITGNPEDEQIQYSKEKRVVQFTHKYYIANHGPSPVNQIFITLYHPGAVIGKDGPLEFLLMTSLEADSGEVSTIPAKCTGSFSKINRTVTEMSVKSHKGSGVFDSSELETVNKTKLAANQSDSSDRHKRSVGESITLSTRNRGEEYTVDCQTAAEFCHVINCVAGPFPNNQKFTRLTLVTDIDLAVLASAWDSWSRIAYVTGGRISISGVNIQPEKHQPDEFLVKTVIVRPGPPTSKEIPQWIIYVSTAAGILLLLIILIIFIKIGFFKRKKKDEMKRMMVQADLKEHEANVTSDDEKEY